jgi:hypothetical protein
MFLLSTVVAPAFVAGQLTIVPVEITSDLLTQVHRNLCGHPPTLAALAEVCPTLPAPERGAFWDGEGLAVAIRPRGGVRGAAQSGDTPVTLADLEAVMVSWRPTPITVIG